jgi:hypothetical protein
MVNLDKPVFKTSLDNHSLQGIISVTPSLIDDNASQSVKLNDIKSKGNNNQQIKMVRKEKGE